jgi:hypothetical protein
MHDDAGTIAKHIASPPPLMYVWHSWSAWTDGLRSQDSGVVQSSSNSQDADCSRRRP